MGNIHDISTVLIIRKVIEIYKQKVTHLAIYGELFLQQKNSNLNPCFFFITVLNKIEIHSENLRLMSVLCIKYLTKKMYQMC